MLNYSNDIRTLMRIQGEVAKLKLTKLWDFGFPEDVTAVLQARPYRKVYKPFYFCFYAHSSNSGVLYCLNSLRGAWHFTEYWVITFLVIFQKANIVVTTIVSTAVHVVLFLDNWTLM
jgi:hypothetical protein